MRARATWTIVMAVLAVPVPACAQEGGEAADPPAAETAAAPESVDVEIREWDVPWEDTRPRDPYVGPDGRIWFVGQRGDYVGVLDPESGSFDRMALDPGTGPHNLIVADDGSVWYAGNRAAHVGRLDPAAGTIDSFPMPDPAARDPHTLVFGQGDAIWFTVQGGNKVGRLDRSTGEVTILDVPTPEARPYGIVVDDTGRPWFTLFGTNKLGTVDPATMELVEHELPRAEARPRRLQVGNDGRIWYVDYAAGSLGRFDPADGSVEEWPAPGGREAQPYGMAVDDEGRMWFVESGPRPNRLVGFDPASESFVAVEPIPSGGGTVRHMVYDPATDSIWFGTDENTIGRARVP